MATIALYTFCAHLNIGAGEKAWNTLTRSHYVTSILGSDFVRIVTCTSSAFSVYIFTQNRRGVFRGGGGGVSKLLFISRKVQEFLELSMSFIYDVIKRWRMSPYCREY